MKLYQFKMLFQECANSYAYEMQVVQFWNSIFNQYSFIWMQNMSAE